MILKASQRANAASLAKHLLNARDNEHVEVHELRGFAADELEMALREAEAVAKGTRCTKFLFSLSLNPPEAENVGTEAFEAAIEMAEQKLGLDGQPRAVVFHEKNGRRHAHVVWSRIDAQTMTARPLPYFKNRLMEVSKELFLEHGWTVPKGLIDQNLRNPLNFNRHEWQQAGRAKQDPRLIKAAFRDCWQRSDSNETLRRALEERGYYLARGDRKSVVAVDYRGEVYSFARWSGVKAKELKTRLGDPDKLPSVAETKGRIAARMGEQLRGYIEDVEAGYARLKPSIEFRRQQMAERQRAERKALNERLAARQEQEAKARASRLPRGISGLWSRIIGRHSKIKRQNEYDAWQSAKRDQLERDALIAKQLDERRTLQTSIKRARDKQEKELADLRAEIAEYLLMRRDTIPRVEEFNERAAAKQNRRRDREVRRDRGGPDITS